MAETARSKHAARRLILSSADDLVLRAVARYHYLTAFQICRLLYSPGSLTYVMEKLKRLAECKLLQRLFLPRVSQHGSGPSVFCLACKGLRYLEAQGLEVRKRFRPSEEREHSYLFFSHTLAVNDVLIAAELLCRQVPQVCIETVLHERVLQRQPVYVTLSTGEKLGVVPDGWLDLRVAGRYQTCLALELDRGTVEQKKWRRKVRGLITWANGPYQEIFGTSALTIAVVATPGQKRRDELIHWTETELTALGAQDQADLFRFTGLAPEAVTPEALFLTPVWHCPFAQQALPLLTVEEEGV